MADTRVGLPACPCPIRARLRRLAPAYTFTGCLLPQAYGKGDKARDGNGYRVQASPTSPAKPLMLTQGLGMVPRREGRPRSSSTPPLHTPGETSAVVPPLRSLSKACFASARPAKRIKTVNYVPGLFCKVCARSVPTLAVSLKRYLDTNLSSPVACKCSFKTHRGTER